MVKKDRAAKLVLMRKVISLFIFSAERNDQTEQEERREIKQRLTRKVRSLYIFSVSTKYLTYSYCDAAAPKLIFSLMLSELLKPDQQ